MSRIDGRLHRLVLLALLWSSSVANAAVIEVPGGVATLQAAIAAVSADGDVIEIAAGTYPSPLAAEDGFPGFRISDRLVDFTIRAANGAVVVLDGQGERPVFRFQNTDAALGGLVTFEGLVFRNGFSNTQGLTAGVTVQRAQATFRDCVFDANVTVQPDTGSGGVAVSLGSIARFERSTWSNNTNRLFGAGLAVEEHENVTVLDSLVTNNSVAVPNHAPTAAGGGIHVGNATLLVERTRFEDNRAGYVGGGLFAVGSWDDTQGGSFVTVRDSTFVGNRAVRSPGVLYPYPTEGGGVHVEDLSSIEIVDSRFLENQANHGGGLNAYRAVVVVRDSEFRGNRASGGEAIGTKSVGGQLNLISNDGVDATTGYGAINRRNASLLVEDSLFVGRYGATTTAADVAGCLFVSGDTFRAFGLAGVPQNGTIEQNRASAVVRRSVFHDCDVQQTAIAGTGIGGALSVDVADLTLEDSLVLDSDAFGLVGANAGTGGGAALLSHSHAAIARTTFAGNTSGSFGGALFAQGVDLDIRDSLFLRNAVAPSVSKPCFQQYGSALFTSPFDASGGRPAQAATGIVATSVVSDNQGVPIYDDDRTNGPINDTRYDANQFFAEPSSGAVFSNTVPNNVAPYSFCINAAQMSALVVQRANLTSTAKSAIANTDLGVVPPAAGLVPAPSKVNSQAAAGDPPPSDMSTLGYAWSGQAAQLDGVVLAVGQGVTPAAAGPHTLVVDAGAAVAQVTVAPEAASVLGALAALGTLLLRWRRRACAASRDGGNAIR